MHRAGGLKIGKTLELNVTPIAAVPAQPSNNTGDKEAEAPKLKVYWGTGTTVAPGEPKTIDTASMDTPAKNVTDSAGKAAEPGSYAFWPTPGAPELTNESAAVGVYTLTTNYQGGTSISLDQDQDFLTSVEPTDLGNHIDLGKPITIEWKPVPNAKAYLLTAYGGDSKNTVMWVSSQNPDWVSGEDLASRAIPSDEMNKLIKDNILLPGSATSCTIPEKVFAGAKGAMVIVTAFGRDVVQDKDGIETDVSCAPFQRSRSPGPQSSLKAKTRARNRPRPHRSGP